MVSVDITKFILSICVVLLHTHGLVLGFIPELSTFNRIIGSLAVPIFLVFSGYFFRQSIEKKALKNVLFDNTLRLIALSLIYQSIWLFFLDSNGNGLTLLISSDAKINLMMNWFYQLFVDGSHQFWYITSLMFCLWFIALFKKFNKENWLLPIALICFFICMINTTWQPIFKSIFFDMLIQPLSLLVSNLYQSPFIALIFVVIGYHFESIYSWIKDKPQISAFCIAIYVCEVAFCSSLKGSLSLWSTSPLLCIGLFSLLMKHPTSINPKIGLWFRHMSTIIYCIHYQLAAFMMSFVKDVLSADRIQLFMIYSVLLLLISVLMVSILNKLSQKHKFFSYFY